MTATFAHTVLFLMSALVLLDIEWGSVWQTRLAWLRQLVPLLIAIVAEWWLFERGFDSHFLGILINLNTVPARTHPWWQGQAPPNRAEALGGYLLFALCPPQLFLSMAPSAKPALALFAINVALILLDLRLSDPRLRPAMRACWSGLVALAAVVALVQALRIDHGPLEERGDAEKAPPAPSCLVSAEPAQSAQRRAPSPVLSEDHDYLHPRLRPKLCVSANNRCW